MLGVAWSHRRAILIAGGAVSLSLIGAGLVGLSYSPVLFLVGAGIGILTAGAAFAGLVTHRLLALWGENRDRAARDRQAMLREINGLKGALASLRSSVNKSQEEAVRERQSMLREIRGLRSDLAFLRTSSDNAFARSGDPRQSKFAAPPPQKDLDSEDDILLGEQLLDRALRNVAAIPTLAPSSAAQPVTLSMLCKSDGPMIAIVIPLFNESRFIAATINSLQRQTFPHFEAIIVDDASTDDSMAVALKAVGSDRRFRFARHAANAGLSAARNTGLRLARAPLISFLDSDDLLFPEALEIRLAKFKALAESGGERSFAGTYCRLVTMPQTITLDEALARSRKQGYNDKIVDFVSSGGECPFNAHAPMLLTDIVRAHGGFDESLRFGCEDWDLWQRIMRNGYAFAPTGRLTGVYRRKRGSMVKETPKEHLETAKLLFERARRPIDPAHIIDGAPFVFSREIQHYQDQARFALRLAQYAVINAFASPQAFRTTIASAPVGGSAYIDAETDLLPQIDAGIRRATALDDSSLDRLSEKTTALARSVLDHFRSRIALPPPHPTQPPAPKDVLFFAQTQAQVRAMAPAARRLSEAGLDICFVTTETETGDQGQRQALAAEGLAFVSLNTACLRQFRTKTFAVMRPYSSVVRDAIPAGARLVEFESADTPVSFPDENLPRSDAKRVRCDEAADQLQALAITAAPMALSMREDAEPFSAPPHIVIMKEESFHQTPDYEALAALRDKWRGERCVIIGNGPSINETDLTKLRNELTFAVNGIFYKKDEMGFDPTFYVVEDSSVMKENIEAIKAYQSQYKLFPTIYRNLHPKEHNVAFFLMNRGFYEEKSPSYCIPRFSVDAARRVYCGQSVTHINLQLAYYFGFTEVYLIGVDFSYVIPKSAIRKGDLITSTEDDPNHFHGDYFGKGKTWKDPKLHRVALNYELARDMFAADGRKVYNATKGGNLEVFERADYDSVFS